MTNQSDTGPIATSSANPGYRSGTRGSVRAGRQTEKDGQTILHGSHAAPASGTRRVGPLADRETVEFTVIVRRADEEGVEAALSDLTGQPPGERRLPTQEEYEARVSAKPEDLAAVERHLREHGVDVVETSPVRRRIAARGTAATVGAALGTSFAEFEASAEHYRGIDSPPRLPAGLAERVVGVFGLDTRQVARPTFRRGPRSETSHSITQLAKLYDFPADGSLTGRGQVIALLQFGGGYRDSDIKQFFDVNVLPHPDYKWVGINGGSNNPGHNDDYDTEVTMDLEISGGIAYHATIVSYFAGDGSATTADFDDALSYIINDTANNPKVLSISWGGVTSLPDFLDVIDQRYRDATLKGITVLAAAGDHGSTAGQEDGNQHVEYQVQSPWVLGCGGTTLQDDGLKVTKETVWNTASGATGGGVSDRFPLPDYQENVGVPHSPNNGFTGRGVPDVAGDADRDTGIDVLIDGSWWSVGGTSAVAPLLAGLIAQANERADGKPRGFVNTFLYANPGAFSDITEGSNGYFYATAGWDACTGLGRPRGWQVVKALAPTPVARDNPRGAATPMGVRLVQPTGRVVFLDNTSHITEFSLSPGGGWMSADLTTATGAPAAAGSPFGYMTSMGDIQSEQTFRVVYRGGDGHIYELYLPSDTMRWKLSNLTAAAGAPLAAGDPMGYLTPMGDIQAEQTARVVYRAVDGHVWELNLRANKLRWAANDLCAASGGAPSAAGDPFGYVTPMGDIQAEQTARVVYRAVDGHVWELNLRTNKLRWAANDLCAASGGAPSAAGNPMGYVTPMGGLALEKTARVLYRAVDGHVWELNLRTNWLHWAAADLSNACGGPPAVSDPFGYLAPMGENPSDPTARVVYVAGDGHVHEARLSTSNRSWRHADLSGGTGAPAAAGSPFGYVTGFNGNDITPTARVLYRASADNHVYELHLPATPKRWALGDLTAAAE
jgi:kumamolisin